MRWLMSRDRSNARLRFVGYTGNERLDRRTAAIYGDDVGLSAARARRAMETIAQQMGLAPAQAEHEGRGYVQSADVVNAGFIQGETSHVLVQVVYDEEAVLDDYEGVDITRMTRELAAQSSYGAQPDAHQRRRRADRRSGPQLFRRPALHGRRARQGRYPVPVRQSRVAPAPEGRGASAAVARDRPAATTSSRRPCGSACTPTMAISSTAPKCGYSAPASRREIDATGGHRDRPGGLRGVAAGGGCHGRSGVDELRFVLRAYDDAGSSTKPSRTPLWLYHETEREAADVPDDAGTPEGGDDTPQSPPAERELLAAYGESALALRNIPLGSGTVKVQGSGIPANHSVWVAGREVPVDAAGNFTAEEILPTGAHTVEVAVLDEGGNGNLYLRDLEFKRKDTFYVGLADFTVSESRTSGPAELLQGAESPFDLDSSLDGRLAFYLNSKFADHWRVTASADTREGPVEDLFSNFLDKSPDSLFRRIDPDTHYPTFGDDGIVEEMAATMGKFYVKVSQGENYAHVGQLRDRLHGQRARPSRPRPVRRQCAITRSRDDDEFRRAPPHGRRIRRGARHDG